LITGTEASRIRFGPGNRLIFWASIAAVTFGILMQLPMLYEARTNHYRLAGMGIPPAMYLGMVLIVVGTVVAVWAL